MNPRHLGKARSGKPNARTSSLQPWSKAVRKIFIVEDHPGFRGVLVRVINAEPDLAVCGQAGTADRALRAIVRLKPDLVLVDLSLPGKNGLELIREIRLKDQQVKLLVLSMHDEGLYADQVLQAGGNGYLMKQGDPGKLIQAIRQVLSGRLYASDKVMGTGGKAGSKPSSPAQPRPFDQLTDSELEILELLGRGTTNHAIARQLHLTPRILAAQVAQVRKKLKFETPQELIRYAVSWVKTGAT